MMRIMTMVANSETQILAGGATPAERLRAFLISLPPTTKSYLMAELKRSRLNGEEIAGADFIMSMITAVDEEQATRADEPFDASPLFFNAIEPFLINERLEQKLAGRILRSSLDPIWTWITRDLLSDVSSDFERAVGRASASGDQERVDTLVSGFIASVCAACEARITHARDDSARYLKLIGELGHERVLEDLIDIIALHRAQEALRTLGSKLPARIRNLQEEGLQNAVNLLTPIQTKNTAVLPYAIASLAARLSQPYQVARLAASVVETDEIGRIASTPWRYCLDFALSDIERIVIRLSVVLKETRRDRAEGILKEFHDAARGLRTELDLASDNAWTRRLSKLRADLSRLLSMEIEPLPGRVRRMLRPRGRDDANPSRMDPSEIEDLEH
ncbi:MAG: hypothetical protein WCH83_16955, partial [Alphaproteobacteria bacterium]